MSKDILGKDIGGVNVDDFQLVIKLLSLNAAITEEVKELTQQYRELLDKHKPEFSAEIKKTLEANPGGQEDDNPQQDRDSQATLPRENSQGERSGENRLTENNRTPHQNADTTVNTNSITTLGENIKQKLQRNKRHIVPALIALLTLSLWPSVCNRSSSLVKDNKTVATEQKDSIKRDSESETIDKVSATGELSHFVKEGESMYSIVTNLKSSWTLSGISSVREDIIRVACEKGFIMKIKEGQTTKGKFDPRDLSPGDVIVIKIKEFEDLHRQ